MPSCAGGNYGEVRETMVWCSNYSLVWCGGNCGMKRDTMVWWCCGGEGELGIAGKLWSGGRNLGLVRICMVWLGKLCSGW